MTDFVMPEKDKVTFKDIMFKHYDRILELTKYQFIGGYTNRTVVGGNIVESQVTDKKEEYCQVVEAFSDILYSHFDDKMTLFYEGGKDEKNKDVKGYLTKYEEEYEKRFTDDMEKTPQDLYKWSAKRLKMDRELFRELCSLLKRKQYLKAELYTQTDKPRTPKP